MLNLFGKWVDPSRVKDDPVLELATEIVDLDFDAEVTFMLADLYERVFGVRPSIYEVSSEDAA